VLIAGCTGEVQRDELPIADNVSGDCQWSEDNDEDVSLACEDGQYRILVKSVKKTAKHIIPRRLSEPVESASVEVDTTLARLPGKGSAAFSGVGCIVSGANKPTRGYIFFVGNTPDGAGYAMARIDETDKSLRDDAYFKFFDDATSDVVGGVGETNHIRGECEGASYGVNLAMFVNGKQVATAIDPGGFHPFDGFAFQLLVPEQGTDISYDNYPRPRDRRRHN